jgi:hypothetical protein
MDEEPDYLPPGPRAEPRESEVVDYWVQAEAGCAARLTKVAGRLGALDDRLSRGPEGWQHPLALMEAADLSWFVGDRVGHDRLALWMSLRLSGVQDDADALARVGWAVRRLTGGPGPQADLAAFLDRRDPEMISEDTERLSDRAGGWLDLMTAARRLHPISRACMGFHLWSLAGLWKHGDRMEAVVTAGRIAASEGKGAVFAPLAMGGAGGLADRWRAVRSTGSVARRDGERCPDRDASLGRYRSLVSAGGSRNVHAIWSNTASLAQRADRMAADLGPDSRGADRFKPCRRAAQSGLAGRQRTDPGGYRARSVPNVACRAVG